MQARTFYTKSDSMLRWTMQDLQGWAWDPLRSEVEMHLPLRWWLLQRIAANPRDKALTFAPFTNAYPSLLLEYFRDISTR
jgi:hypothetical protein